MKYVNQLGKEGKLTVRRNEEKPEPEYRMKRDSSLKQSAVCLTCRKTKCSGGEHCYRKEAERRERKEAENGMDG